MLLPTTGSVPCANGVAVDKFAVLVVHGADGEGCTGCFTDSDGYIGGRVAVLERFRIVDVVLVEIRSLSSTLFFRLCVHQIVALVGNCRYTCVSHLIILILFIFRMLDVYHVA